MAKSWQEIYKEINQAKIDKKYKAPKSQKWIVVDPNTGKEHSFSDSTNAQNYIKVQTKKMNEPKKPTTYELEAEAINRYREGKATGPDSTRLGIVPTDIQQAKIDAKPKKEKTVNQKIADIDNILSADLDLTENEIAKYDSQRRDLVKELMKQYGGSQDSTDADSSMPEPEKKLGWYASRKAKIKAFKTKRSEILKKIESGELGEIPKKYLVNGDRAGQMWANDLAKIEMETPADPLGLRK